MQVLPVSWSTAGTERVLVAPGAVASTPTRSGRAAEVGLDVLSSASRLVVLVPAAGVDAAELASEVRRLDSGNRLEILYLALAPSAVIDEAWLRRELITLGSLTRDARRPVELRVEVSRNWIEAVGQVRREGDVFLCIRGAGARWTKPEHSLAESLAQTFGGPVVELQGLHLGGVPSGGGLARTMRGAASLLIVAAFLGVQIEIERHLTLTGWTRPTLQALLLGVELWLIWRWESRAMWPGG